MPNLSPLLLALFIPVAIVTADESYLIDSPLNRRPMLGVEMTPPPQHVLEREGLNPDQGVLVQDVYSDTAADSMGLQKGDVILEINGMPIGSMQDVRNEVGLANVGDPLEVSVSRGGQQLNLAAMAKPWPASIPQEKLDHEAEQRFRDWQQRRMERSKDELGRMGKELDQLADQLKDTPPAWYGPVPRGADGRPLAMPAWSFTWQQATPRQLPKAEPVTVPKDLRLAPTDDGTPWSIEMRVANAATAHATIAKP